MIPAVVFWLWLVQCFFASIHCYQQIENQNLLLESLNKVSGVYKDPLIGKNIPNIAKTVVVTACNFGFLNHLENFHCYAGKTF